MTKISEIVYLSDNQLDELSDRIIEKNLDAYTALANEETTFPMSAEEPVRR